MQALKRLLVLASLIFLGLGSFARADLLNGWEDLFDGKTLKGWTSSKENSDSYFVEDGVLILRGGRSHLFYTGPVGGADFKNFELSLRVRTTPGSNSGVYFHTRYQDEGWPELGFEAQVNSTQKDPKKTGSLYAVANVYVPTGDEEPFIVRVGKLGAEAYREQAPSKDGEWFDYLIIVDGDTVTLKVNGKTTVQWTQPEGWAGPNPKMSGRKLGQGTIALQAHDPDSEVHYKEIRIRRRR